MEDLIRIALAFLEGIALIVSPCILPILPIILSGSLIGNKQRPLGIISGFVITFAIITLFSRAIIQFTAISQDTLRIASFVILIALGLIMISSYLTEKFNTLTNRLLNVGANWQLANNNEGGYLSGLIFGCLVGIIWTPCAGPILAAVIVQVVIQKTTFSSILTILAFAIGAGLPMLLIALLGRQVVQRFTFFRDHTTLIRKLLGVIIVLSVLVTAFMPINLIATAPKQTQGKASLIDGLSHPIKAPEIIGITDWINSPPLSIAGLKGKVVLIDFWTYSCINCIRTLPYIKEWYNKYHKDGLEIIGVHSPEFAFEHDLANVKNAVAQDEIRYPVALDNAFATWQNFKNAYWPAHYLINKEGYIVYEHFGEGDYEVTENNIRYLLNLNEPVAKSVTEKRTSDSQTPETYLGYARAKTFASKGDVLANHSKTYHFPANIGLNQWALQGDWTIYSDKIVANTAGASIKLHFIAKHVYAVMGSVLESSVNVKLNAQTQKNLPVKDNKLYTLLSFANTTEGYLELVVVEPGVTIYTFTFG